MLHNQSRWCLWLESADPVEVRSSKFILDRLRIVSDARLASPTSAAREKAKVPGLFLAIRQPSSRWIGVPAHSSELRRIVPMAFFDPEEISHNSLMQIEGGDEYLFGLLQSAMWTTWVRSVGGRLESRIRINPDLCYNAFPFPTETSVGRERVTAAAIRVLSARELYSPATLADLYAPLTMPVELVNAHDALDSAVDSLYGDKKFLGEADRLEFLFTRYAELTADLLTEVPIKKNRKKKTTD